MLKKFFISMLGTMAGLWLSLIFLILIIVMAVVIGVAKAVGGSGGVSERSILYIDLTGTVAERASEASVYSLLSYMDEAADDLASTLKAIRAAADDKKIEGIYINCGGSEMGVASRTELTEALASFRKSGKWIYAYADNMTQGDYYIASVADSVYLNPVGMLDIHGLASQTMFYKNLLDKLGVDVEVVRVGSFKSAVEPFLRNDMSPESRLQTEVFLGQLWSVMTKTIAENRGLKDASVVNAWADSLTMCWPPQRYLDIKAVTGLRYRTGVEDMLRNKVGLNPDDDLPLVTPTEYVESSMTDLVAATKPHVAVLYAVGDIVVEASSTSSEGIASADLVPLIEQLKNDDNVKALVLRVNSGGGSAFASEQIWHALEDFKATGRPFYVSMGDYAASGGYYISCGADRIFCDPTTITGSIGIFGIIPNAENLVENKIGIGIQEVQTNPNATFPSPLVKPTSAQIAGMQRYVEMGYDTFTSRVSQGRGISVDSVKAIGGGRVWDGLSARRIGLVDSIGSLNAAVSAIAAKVGLDTKDVVAYPEIKTSAFAKMLKDASKQASLPQTPLTSSEAEEFNALVNRIKAIVKTDPLQARMEDLIVK